MKKFALVCSLVLLVSVPSFADPQFLYANNAVEGVPYIYQIDPATGNVLQTITNLQGFNGRGVIDVNNILYYTVSTDGNVYKYDLTTHTQLGVAFTVAGASGLASVTYKGTDFWIGDYGGSNHAFMYTPTGTQLKTITLDMCSSFCDGLTFFRSGGTGFLLSNRFDGGLGGPNSYDVYDTNGNFIMTLFTSTSSASTGVAWDGSHFWTSNTLDGTVTEWSMSGVQMGTEPLTGFQTGFSPLVEGMSFNFAQTLVPEPGTLVMFGTGVLGLAGLLRGKMNVQPMCHSILRAGALSSGSFVAQRSQS